jgi:hypothetical protein
LFSTTENFEEGLENDGNSCFDLFPASGEGRDFALWDNDTLPPPQLIGHDFKALPPSSAMGDQKIRVRNEDDTFLIVRIQEPHLLKF